MKREKIEGGKIIAKELHPGQRVYFGENVDGFVVKEVNVEKSSISVPIVTFEDVEEFITINDIVYTDKKIFLQDMLKDAENKQNEEDIRWKNETVIHDSYAASLWLRVKKFKEELEKI